MCRTRNKRSDEYVLPLTAVKKRLPPHTRRPWLYLEQVVFVCFDVHVLTKRATVPTYPQGEDAPKKVMLGRPGNNVKVGIVGVPNVGKSSFFNILGKMHVPAENFPFCTIDPNVAIVPVPDQRFKWLIKKYKPVSEVPPNMTITDIAGLVKVGRSGRLVSAVISCANQQRQMQQIEKGESGFIM